MKKIFRIICLAMLMCTLTLQGVIGQDLRQSIEVYKDYINVTINGEPQEVDNFLYEGSTYIGLRQVSELLGATVDYESETKTAIIKTKTQSNDSLTKEVSDYEEGRYYRFPANPEKGFHFPYYIYFPKGYRLNDTSFLLVESNNGGVSDNFSYHEAGVVYSVGKESYGKSVSEELRTPFLMPVFPRTMTNWEDYTHDLDRSTLLAKLSEEEKVQFGNYERIDEQLVAMIEDARDNLENDTYKIEEKVLMVGYSASAKFANKFSLLHPTYVHAMVIGGINAATMLPVEEYKGVALNYPLGTSDYKAITGKAFDAKSYEKIHQLFIMGETDDNDVTHFRDGWDEDEAKTWWAVMGAEMMPTRWNNLIEAYESMPVSIQFHTYSGIGHTVNNDVTDDTVQFLLENMGEDFTKIVCHP